MGKETISYERHPLLFKKGKLLAKGGLIEVQGTASNPRFDIHRTILEGTYVTNAGFKPQSEHRVYERQRIQYGNPASKTHKGTQSTKVDAKYSPRLGKYATQRKIDSYKQSTGHLKDF